MLSDITSFITKFFNLSGYSERVYGSNNPRRQRSHVNAARVRPTGGVSGRTPLPPLIPCRKVTVRIDPFLSQGAVVTYEPLTKCLPPNNM